jgi:hypothetical protein
MQTKAQFLQQLDALHGQWQALLAQVPPDRVHEPGVDGRWSVADLVYHMAWYEQEMVTLLTTLTLAGSPWWALPHDERNEKIWEEARKRPYPTIALSAHITHQALIAALQTLPEQALHTAAAFTNMPDNWQPLDLLAQNSTIHYQQHIPALQTWLNNQLTDNK